MVSVMDRYKAKSALLAAAILLLALPARPQGYNYKWEVSGRVKLTTGTFEGVTMKLSKNGMLVEQMEMPRNGRFDFELDYQSNYLFVFEKDGYVTKQVIVDTHVPQKLVDDPDFIPHDPFTFHVNLFKPEEDVSMEFRQPVASIKYYPDLNDFNYDTNYAADLRRKTDEPTKPAPAPAPSASAAQNEIRAQREAARKLQEQVQAARQAEEDQIGRAHV